MISSNFCATDWTSAEKPVPISPRCLRWPANQYTAVCYWSRQAWLMVWLVEQRARQRRCFVRACRSWVLILNDPWFLVPSLCCLRNGFLLVRMPSFLATWPWFPIRAPNSWLPSPSIPPRWHRQCLGKNRSSHSFRSPPMAVPSLLHYLRSATPPTSCP